MLTNTLEAWELAKARRKEEDKRRAAEDAKRKEEDRVRLAEGTIFLTFIYREYLFTSLTFD